MYEEHENFAELEIVIKQERAVVKSRIFARKFELSHDEVVEAIEESIQMFSDARNAYIIENTEGLHRTHKEYFIYAEGMVYLEIMLGDEDSIINGMPIRL